MRPKSALFYIKELNETTEELVAKVAENLNAQHEATNLNYSLQRFALEAIGIMFIGTRLGCLQANNPNSLKFIATVDSFFSTFQALLMWPIWVLKLTGTYRQSLKDMTAIFEFCQEKIGQALARHDRDGSLEGTVLLRR